MGFKTDREFLRNVTIGAVGTQKVAKILRAGGFRIIELERYSASNKIWATKIKRLRVPDLLCLRTGIRIESRAKSDLKLTMSHAVNNPKRAWDRGLRDTDLVAFILCSEQSGTWTASERVALFPAADLRSTARLAGLSRMKAASEGSEIQLTWPATIPSRAGRVTAVTGDKIETELDTGRRQTYSLVRSVDGGAKHRLFPYVGVGDPFGAGDTVIASVLPQIVQPICSPSPQYDFVRDLNSADRATVYAAIKALGFLPELMSQSCDRLKKLHSEHEEPLLRLEAAGALARLDIDEGWKAIRGLAASVEHPVEVRMESALILAELGGKRAEALLLEIAAHQTTDPELRAAAIWGLASVAEDLEQIGFLEFLRDADEITAAHAIAGLSARIDDRCLPKILGQLGADDRQSAGIVRAILTGRCDPMRATVELIRNASGSKRLWLLYVLASLGRQRCAEYVNTHAPELLSELDFFWTHHVDNWTNRLDVADQIDFLLAQTVGQ